MARDFSSNDNSGNTERRKSGKRDLNKVMLTGHLGKDVDVRATQNGDPVVTISVASSRGDDTEWFRVVAWERLAETFTKLADMGALKKGSHVYIEGRFKTRKWKDKEGLEHTTTEVVASDLMLLDKKPQESRGEGDDWTAPSVPAKSNSRYNEAEEMEPEDIPF